MTVRVSSNGDFSQTKKFLRLLQSDIFDMLDRYGAEGVELLRAATPSRTGETAASWYYRIEHEGNRHILWWGNNHEHEGVNIAIIIQHGHGTGTGGFVHGIDYINPALRPLFDKMAADIWRQVINA